jgi:hypothetical protein
MIHFFLVFALLFLGACQPTTPPSLSQEESKAVLSIFDENQKIQEKLLASPTIIPNIADLLQVVQTARNTVSIPEYKPLLGQMVEILEKGNYSEQEPAFLALSQFSEKLDTLGKMATLGSYHKFYCPMVKKYWVAKGKEIQNPYDADMRECGELVR